MINPKFVQQMKDIAAELDVDFLMKETAALTDLEYPQTFKARANAANYAKELLLREGFSNVEKVDFPADGKTAYQDKRMPISWDVTNAKLTILSAVPGLERKVVADYQEHPYSIVWGSTSIPEGKRSVRIIPEAEVFMGEDARGALVLLESNGQARDVLASILDLGAIGFVSERVVGDCDTPDDITWINNATEDSGHWHVQADDRDFIAFSISPRRARALRAAVNKGQVWALIESDAHRHTEGKVGLVSATLPGESERELWLIAHLFEPIATDNSCGVITAIEMARQIRRMLADGRIKKLKYTLRFIFSMELYGTSAASDYFGGYLGDRCIGALNIDGMPITKDDPEVMTFVAPYSAPFCGNYVSINSLRTFEEAFPDSMKFKRIDYTTYGDDCPLNDSTVNLPTVWTHHNRTSRISFHHNSKGTVDYIDEKRCREFVAANVFFAQKMIAPEAEDIKILTDLAITEANDRLEKLASALGNEPEATSRMRYYYEGEKKHILDFKKYISESEAEALADRLVCPEVAPDKEVALSRWQKYAKGVVAKRLTVGLPHDLANIPFKDRKALPGLALYAPFANALANLDGKKDFYTVVKEAFWENGITASDSAYKKYVTTLHYLADAGYIEIKDENELTKSDIVAALKRVGLKEGDTVMIHSSVSAFGLIIGGVNTIVEAFLEVVGKEGTIMAPAFTRPYMYFEGAHQRQRNFRPFDPKNIDGISTGTLPKVMLRDFGAKRSAHATHSWCAIGKNADYCVSAHGLLDSPCGKNNPMEKALGLGGKVVFFGCGVSSNTFLHYLEDGADSNFLENAIIKIVREDGKQVTEIMRNHLPGCRDFYYFLSPEGCKFYDRAVERGLNISHEIFGTGDIYKMELSELYEIGTELFREDPDVTLCDRPQCVFCARYRHKK